MRVSLRRHPIVSYVAIAFALSWAIWIAMALAGVRVCQLVARRWYLAALSPLGFFAIAAAATQ